MIMKQDKFTMIIIMRKAIFAIVSLFLLTSSAHAATRTMSACTSAAWDTAYAAATTGDTVAFPDGTCALTMAKTIGKSITVLGKGTTNGTTMTGGFTITSNNVRITAMRLVGQPSVTVNASSGIRIDHNYFYNAGYFLEFLPNMTNSVVDNNTFDTITASGIYIWGQVPRSSPGFPYALGAASGGAGIYFEDNNFINLNNAGHVIIQSRGGSRIVVRYNKFNLYLWDPFDAHDNYEYTPESGSATFEYYNNVLNYTGTDKRIFHMRGGQGVIYNNYVTGSQNPGIQWDSYILCSNTCTKGSVGICSWQVQKAYTWGNKQGFSSLASCDPHNMAACGSGSTWDSVATCSGGAGSNQQLVENVDYFNSAMPGYTPYTYPHPLRNVGIPEPGIPGALH
jgi:hypothetical protein